MIFKLGGSKTDFEFELGNREEKYHFKLKTCNRHDLTPSLAIHKAIKLINLKFVSVQEMFH